MRQIDSALLRIRPASLASALKHALRIQRQVIETPAGRFYIDPVSNFGVSVQQALGYEPELSWAIRALLREGDVFLDLGANEGYFSIVAAKAVAPNGRVAAIEPQSRLQEVLARNIAENGVLNVDVIRYAVSDSTGVATLSISPDMNTGSTGLFAATRYNVPTENVPQITLSGLFELLSLRSVRLIKLDIESFEYEVILGSRNVFRSGMVEYLALELHPSLLARRGKSEKDILDFLADCGYRRDGRFEALILGLDRS